MKCSNCGAEIADNSLFCTYCGTKQEKPAPVEEAPIQEAQPMADEPAQPAEEAPVQETPVQEAQPAEEAPAQEAQPAEEAPEQPVEEAPVQEKPVQEAQPAEEAPVQETPVQETQPAEEAPAQEAQYSYIPEDNVENVKKSNKKIMIGLGVVGAVAVVGLIVGGVKLVGNMSGKPNEKAIVYIKDDSLYYSSNMDKEDKEIEIDDSRDGFSEVRLIDNGKKLVYLDNKKNELKLAELTKLKKDSSKNDKYITDIDKDVADFIVYDDKEIYYMTEDEDFYYYNGKDSVKVDDEVVDIHGHLGDKICYSKDEKDEKVDLYTYDPKKDSSDKLKKSVTVEADYLDKLYVLDGDELLSFDEKGKEEKVAEDVSSVVDIDDENDIIYFTKDDVTKKKGIDFVEDDCPKEEPKEPEEKDYLTETTPELSFDEYRYTTYITDPVAFLNSYYMYEDEDMGMKYTYGKDYDRVYTDGTKWYLYDDDAYYDDYWDYQDDLYDYEDAEEMREELEEMTIETSKMDLYIVKKGKETLIKENVGGVKADASKEIAFYYEKEDKKTDKIKLSELSYAGEIEYLVDDDYEDDSDADYFYQIGTSKSQKFKENAYHMSANHKGNEIVVGIKDEDADYDDGFKLVAYKISGSELKEIDVLSKNAGYGYWADGAYYFMSDVDYSEDKADLSVFKDGKTEEIAKNVSTNYGAVITEKDSVVCLSDDEDLLVYDNKGDKEKVDKNVSNYTVVNSNRIVYVKNEDLYVYTGKDSNKIANNIDSEYNYWVNQNEDCMRIY
ncbi:MAG: zinc-ribbon domain-containing protein [Agathobacter sp.]|nr:zinc-ribbon domain-containing protein [Agathobacter sp.]